MIRCSSHGPRAKLRKTCVVTTRCVEAIKLPDEVTKKNILTVVCEWQGIRCGKMVVDGDYFLRYGQD